VFDVIVFGGGPAGVAALIPPEASTVCASSRLRLPMTMTSLPAW
jgi:hypothetical protein